MVLQIVTRRSRASRLRQTRSPWLYGLVIAAGLAAAVLLALRPLIP